MSGLEQKAINVVFPAPPKKLQFRPYHYKVFFLLKKMTNF